VQQDIAQYYETNFPGQVQVVGVDEYNGTAAQLRSFKDQTGAGYPLLLLGATATGGNFATLYGTFDNYVVVNKQGIVRYHAALLWPHGNRYHLNEIRGSVDSLVTQVVGVDPGPSPAGYRLATTPNPARGAAMVELAIPAGGASAASVTVHDVRGRHVATLLDGPAAAGLTRLAWSHTDASGARLAPGVYLVRARIDTRILVHRAVVLP
jgi:flagellar hook capping protein FlgD